MKHRTLREAALGAWVAAVVLTLAALAGCALAERQRQPSEWVDSSERVASTEARRLAALKRIGLERGDRLIALISIRCGECDVMAQQLDRKGTPAVILADAPVKEMDRWARSLKLRYVRYISVKPETMEDLGAVLLPTLIEVKDGRYLRVRQDGRI